MYPTPRAAQVQEMLGLPENIIPLAIVPVGYPAEQPAVKQKYNESLIHCNKW
jgi:nitroreductase